MKICVVDDELQVSASIIQKIKAVDPDSRVIDGGYGSDALRRIHSATPDLVFLDIRMPNMDGLELLLNLKRDMPWTSVVILSGYDEFEYARQAMRRGAYDYLLKPVNRHQLDQTIRKVNAERKRNFAQELEPYKRQLLKDSVSMGEIECVNVGPWYQTHVRKGIRITGGGPDERQGICEDVIFTCTVNQQATCCVYEDVEGTFADPAYFSEAFLKVWKGYAAKRFFGENRFGGNDGFDEEAPQRCTGLRSRIVQSVGEDSDVVHPLLSQWMDFAARLDLPDLLRESSLLLALLDESLTRPGERLVISGESVSYWRQWVESFDTWDLLEGAMGRLIVEAVSASREAKERLNAERHWAKKALEYIKQSTDPDLNLSSVAAAVGVHPVTLSRMFKAYTGCNFNQYVTRHRLQLARSQLVTTTKPAWQIAMDVGYTDYHYFRTLFKKEFGIPPKELRGK